MGRRARGAQGWTPIADAVAGLDLPELQGDGVSFVVLPDRDLLVEEELGDASLKSAATALERQVKPPYRAGGRRQGRSSRTFVAQRIEVVEMPGEPADSIMLARHDGEETVEGTADPARWRELGQGLDDYVLEAARLDGDLFEVKLSPL